MNPPAHLTIAEAARRIGAGRLSPVVLAESRLERIARLNPRLAAFVHVATERALADARRAEAEIRAGRWRGPLHGIPIAFKDIFETAGIPTTAHSRRLLNYVPTTDAAVVQRLHAAGAVLLGKLATHEFAFWGPSDDLPFPPARNPWDLERSPGGSSSGAGAAVAAGLCLGSIGSDTGGSIRSPSSLCGITGLKPTYGLVSRRGMLPLSPSLDHAGPMAWTAEDCALLLPPLAGHDPDDPASVDRPLPDLGAALARGVSGLRIGVVRDFYETDASPEVCDAIEALLRTFARLGARVRTVRLSPIADYHACGLVILLAEAYAIHAHDLRTRPGDFGAFLRDQLPLGGLLTAADYLAATRRRAALCAEMAACFAEVDLLVTANQNTPAPRLADVGKFAFAREPFRGMPFNLTGAPALSVCAGFTRGGLPLSAQLAGRPFDDATVLAAGHAYEQATEWRHRRPDL